MTFIISHYPCQPTRSLKTMYHSINYSWGVTCSYDRGLIHRQRTQEPDSAQEPLAIKVDLFLFYTGSILRELNLYRTFRTYCILSDLVNSLSLCTMNFLPSGFLCNSLVFVIDLFS